VKSRRVTWAEAELVCPGIEAEWRSMLGQEGTLIPPSGLDWRVTVYEGVRDPFDYHGRNPKDQSWMVELTPTSDDDWYMRRLWRRWPGGDWTHPWAIKHSLMAMQRMEYSYKPKTPEEITRFLEALKEEK
jgi:hypothetical protein